MLHGLIAIVATLLLALPTSPVHQVDEDSVSPTTARLRLDPPGGAALKGPTWSLPRTDPDEAFTRSGPIYPSSVAEADADDPPYYDHGCHLTGAGTVPGDNCVYGDRRGSTDVWVLGDSKVGQWFAALDAVAKREGWRLTVHTKSACPYAPSLPLPSKPTDNDRRCREYNQRLEELVLQASPDVVITASGKRGPALTNAYVRTWSDLRANGTDRVVALWDSPEPAPSGPACLGRRVPDGDYLEGCAYEQGVSASATLESAAQQVGGVDFLSMGDWVCPVSRLSPRCPAVIGRTLVYRRGSHLTTTYVASLTDALHERLRRAGVAEAPRGAGTKALLPPGPRSPSALP